jgi:hypothetical protein
MTGLDCGTGTLICTFDEDDDFGITIIQEGLNRI